MRTNTECKHDSDTEKILKTTRHSKKYIKDKSLFKLYAMPWVVLPHNPHMLVNIHKN